MQLVWECRTDAIKLFFPPADFDPSLAPAMLSCTALNTSAVGFSRLRPGEGLPPASSTVRSDPVDNGANAAAPKNSSAPEGGDIGGSERKQGASGQEGDEHLRQERLDAVGERPLGDERNEIAGEAVTAAAAGGERRGRRGGQPDSGGGSGGGGGDRHNRNDKMTAGMSLLRPYAIDLKEEVKATSPESFLSGRTAGLKTPCSKWLPKLRTRRARTLTSVKNHSHDAQPPCAQVHSIG